MYIPWGCQGSDALHVYFKGRGMDDKGGGEVGVRATTLSIAMLGLCMEVAWPCSSMACGGWGRARGRQGAGRFMESGAGWHQLLLLARSHMG